MTPTPLPSQFRLAYQPQMQLRTGELFALHVVLQTQDDALGWQDADLETRRHWQLSVWHEAFHQLATWYSVGYRWTLSLDADIDFLSTPEALACLTEHRRHYPNHPEVHIQLDFSLGYQPTKLLGTLRLFRELRTVFLIDNFGSGHANLDVLRQLTTGCALLHPQFTRTLYQSVTDFQLVQTILQMGRTFHHSIIAKAIDDQKTGTLLLRMGCEIGQGKAISDPLSATDVPIWTRRWQNPIEWQAPDANPWPEQYQHLLKASVAHHQWLARLEAKIQANTHQTDEILPMSHLHCDFGRWLSNQGIRMYGHLDSFSEVDLQHRMFHLAADELTRASQDSDQDLTGYWQKVRAISQTLETHLLALKDDLLIIMTRQKKN